MLHQFGTLEFWDTTKGNILATVDHNPPFEKVHFISNRELAAYLKDGSLIIGQLYQQKDIVFMSRFPEFWLGLFFGALLLWSVWRDRRELRKKTAAHS